MQPLIKVIMLFYFDFAALQLTLSRIVQDAHLRHWPSAGRVPPPLPSVPYPPSLAVASFHRLAQQPTRLPLGPSPPPLRVPPGG